MDRDGRQLRSCSPFVIDAACDVACAEDGRVADGWAFIDMECFCLDPKPEQTDGGQPP
jgi:hypothetical protein